MTEPRSEGKAKPDRRRGGDVRKGMGPLERVFSASGMKYADYGYSVEVAANAQPEIDFSKFDPKEREMVRQLAMEAAQNLANFLSRRLLNDDFEDHPQREAWKKMLSGDILAEYNSNRFKSTNMMVFYEAITLLTSLFGDEDTPISDKARAVIQEAAAAAEEFYEIAQSEPAAQSMPIKEYAETIAHMPVEELIEDDMAFIPGKVELSEDQQSVNILVPQGYEKMKGDAKIALVQRVTKSAQDVLGLFGYAAPAKATFNG